MIGGSKCLPKGFLNYTTGKMAKAASQAQTIVSSVMPALTGGVSTSALLLVGFLADVDIYTYINVPFPDNFVSFIEQLRSSILPNLFASLDTMHDGNNPSSTIGKFQFWDLSATLLDNSNTTVFKELILFAIIIGINILVLISKSFRGFSQSMLKIRTIFMWNVFLSFYLGDFSELQLNSMIQLRENSLWSAYTILSFVFAVLVVTSYPLLLGYLIYRTNQRQPQPQKGGIHSEGAPQNQQWVKVPPSLEILVEDFRDTNSFTRNFIFIMLLETFLQILIVFFFQDNGLTQAILHTIVIVVYIVLIAWQRPYRSKLQMGILLLNQVSKAVMGILAIIVGIDNTIQFLSPELIDVIGSFLIILILAVIGINCVLSIGIMIISLFQSIKECYLKVKYRKKQPSVHGARKRANIKHTKKTHVIEKHNRSMDEGASFDSHNGLNTQNGSHLLSLSNDKSMTLATRTIDSTEKKTIPKTHIVSITTKKRPFVHDSVPTNNVASSSGRERSRKHISRGK